MSNSTSYPSCLSCSVSGIPAVCAKKGSRSDAVPALAECAGEPSRRGCCCGCCCDGGGGGGELAPLRVDNGGVGEPECRISPCLARCLGVSLHSCAPGEACVLEPQLAAKTRRVSPVLKRARSRKPRPRPRTRPEHQVRFSAAFFGFQVWASYVQYADPRQFRTFGRSARLPSTPPHAHIVHGVQYALG